MWRIPPGFFCDPALQNNFCVENIIGIDTNVTVKQGRRTVIGAIGEGSRLVHDQEGWRGGGGVEGGGEGISNSNRTH